MNENRLINKEAKRQRPSLLDEVLERRMLLYVLAAGATLAAASGAAQAKVVFTPSNANVYLGGLQIDLNNDGTTDFVLSATYHGPGKFQRFARGVRRPPGSFCLSSQTLSVYGKAASDDVMREVSSSWAAALANGAKIGSSADFANREPMAHHVSFRYSMSQCGGGSSGPFANVHGAEHADCCWNGARGSFSTIRQIASKGANFLRIAGRRTRRRGRLAPPRSNRESRRLEASATSR
jgi:hypothetical protein